MLQPVGEHLLYLFAPLHEGVGAVILDCEDYRVGYLSTTSTSGSRRAAASFVPLSAGETVAVIENSFRISSLGGASASSGNVGLAIKS